MSFERIWGTNVALLALRNIETYYGPIMANSRGLLGRRIGHYRDDLGR